MGGERQAADCCSVHFALHTQSYVCANVVCGEDGVATGVLLRAGEVVEGIELARERRLSTRTDADLARGPARLTVALGITLADGGDDLRTGPIRLEAASHPVPAYATGPRTGVAGEGGSDAFPWRFWIPGDPTVSPYKPAARRVRTAPPR
jgi:DNA-3-methyladenine glycosylase